MGALSTRTAAQGLYREHVVVVSVVLNVVHGHAPRPRVVATVVSLKY